MESENYWLAAWNNFADFSGRATRSEYWLFTLETTVIGLILGGFFSLISNTTDIRNMPETDPLLGIIILCIAAILFVLLGIVGLGVTVRRLHDTGRSGWWVLIGIIPYIGRLVIFIFMVLDSEPGENQYGPSPKGLRREIDRYLNPS